MPINTRLPEGVDEFDVIVAGGGSAGCVVAGRLAAADANLSVLLIEGGENNQHLENVKHPALFREHTFPGSKTTVAHEAKRSADLGDRQPIVHTGGVLGGGSSVNIMLYTRGQRSDYDSWDTPGWSTSELIPYFQKLETYHGHGPKEIHGYNGPIQITRGPFNVAKTEDDFIKACETRGIPAKPDMQDFDTANGVEKWHGTIDATGRRQDAAYCYIHPLLADGKHPNLHVLCQQKVVRVLFDDSKRACGIEYVPNPEYQPVQNADASSQTPSVVRARKQIVLSCGSLGTPPILERSGIGSEVVLEKAGVKPLVDLPGVGNNYQDHNLILWLYRANLSAEETLDAFMSGRYLRSEALKEGDATLGWNACDGKFSLTPTGLVSAKVRPSPAQLSDFTPKFRHLFKTDFEPKPDRPLVIFTLHSGFLGPPNLVAPGSYMSMAAYTTYPYSHGHIHITGPSISSPLDFSPNFFTGPNADIDIETHIWAYKTQREIMRRTDMYAGELSLGHPTFPTGSAAALVSDSARGSTDAAEIKDIVYTAEDDKAIEAHLRQNVGTTFHSLGTTKMAPREEGGAVDERLRVYGVSGLMVADLSIVPENVGANTNNTALMIGEKAAAFIGEQLGLVV